MSKIRIKNFGPVKGGYEGDGWMDIKKVTMFIGNQGCGKSTVAKLISTFMWIEKALINGNLSELNQLDFIEERCNYFRLKKYFRAETELSYSGEYCEISYRNENIEYHLKEHNDLYKIPKIMYVPAERSFLSSVEDADIVSGLPKPLVTFMVENDRSLAELKEPLLLPLGTYPVNHNTSNAIRYHIKYDALKKISYIVGNGYELELTAASSGLHSVVPLYIVSRNLSELIATGKTDTSLSNLNSRQLRKRSVERREARIDMVINESDEQAGKLEAIIESKYKNSFFVNIVEEPEQNLFPSSQKEILNSLIEYNQSPDNKLIITTHSPYLINYLTVAIGAYNLLEKIRKAGKSDTLNTAVYDVIPEKNIVNPNDLVIYEMDEKTGLICLLGNYRGMPSDENMLNSELGFTNDEYSKLIEIEKLCR